MLSSPDGRVYHAAAIAGIYPARLAIRARSGDPAAFSSRLRDLCAVVNPNLQVRDIATAEIIVKREQGMFRMIGVTVGLVMLSVIALSAAGIYALMSFTVARRRREIGIRAAIGMVSALGLEQLLEGQIFQGYGAVILPLVAIVMTTVGLLAAIGPARQGLRIQPTEALREE